MADLAPYITGITAIDQYADVISPDPEATFKRLMTAAKALDADDTDIAQVQKILRSAASLDELRLEFVLSAVRNKTGIPPTTLRKHLQPPAPLPEISATAFQALPASEIPRRPWLYGWHLIRKQVSVTVAPGGVGKSSLTICEALAMVSGRDLLGDNVKEPGIKVWLFNLEDPRDEMARRIIAAMQHHGIAPEEIAGRLFVDTGRERTLCTAIQTRDGVEIIKPEMEGLSREIEARGIDVLVVDPFVSSHQASENDNGAIDVVAKEWARLADRCNCAIELVHHTRKANGETATTESARGATALLAAARSGRVLNKMNDALREQWGLLNDTATFFSVERDKANLAPAGVRVWRRMASVSLANGDSVGVAEAWTPPDTFDGVTPADLLAVQRALDGKGLRYSDQAGDDWAGHAVAEVLGLDATADRKRIKKMIKTWIDNGALARVMREGPQRRDVPCVEVGEWATAE